MSDPNPRHRALSTEHQFLKEAFAEAKPEALTALAKFVVGCLEKSSGAHFESADLADSTFTILQLGSERLIRLKDANGKTVGGLVIEVQLRRKEDKRDTWPIYAWVGRRQLGGKPTDVVVIAPNDSVARWAQAPIPNSTNTFTVNVIGRHNLPVITDEKVAFENPLLALLSAGVHLQSRKPPKGSSLSQAEKTRQDVQQLLIADKIANSIGFSDREDYIKLLFNRLSAEAKKMASGNGGPILTSIEQAAQQQVQAAHNQMVEMVLDVYRSAYTAEVSPELVKKLSELVTRNPDALRNLNRSLLGTNDQEAADRLINAATQLTLRNLAPTVNGGVTRGHGGRSQ